MSKISDMQGSSPLAGNELVPVVQSGVNVTTTPDAIAALVDAGLDVVETLPDPVAEDLPVGKAVVYEGGLWVVVDDEGKEFVQVGGSGGSNVSVIDILQEEFPDLEMFNDGDVFFLHRFPEIDQGSTSLEELYVVRELDDRGSIVKSAYKVGILPQLYNNGTLQSALNGLRHRTLIAIDNELFVIQAGMVDNTAEPLKAQPSIPAPAPYKIVSWDPYTDPDPLLLTVADHAYAYIRADGSYGGAVQVPLDATQDFEIGSWIKITNYTGSNAIAIVQEAPGSGPYIHDNGAGTGMDIGEDHVGLLIKFASNSWDLIITSRATSPPD